MNDKPNLSSGGFQLRKNTMLGTGSSLTPMCSSLTIWNSHPTLNSSPRSPHPIAHFNREQLSSLRLSTFCHHMHLPFLHTQKGSPTPDHLIVKAASSSSAGNDTAQFLWALQAFASVGNAEYAEEPATNVKFQTSLSLPGCSSSLSLLGTGFREKVFAIIGVKVYAAGFYVNPSILSSLDAWEGKSASEIQGNSVLFTSIFEVPLEKSMQIVLVRDVDGKTFWNALDEAISPRIKAPDSADEFALSKFRSIFQGRSLKKGTSIFLTWFNHSEMLVSVSSEGMPSGVEAKIVSSNVTFALYDVFLGDGPVSPSLKASVASGLASVLK